ncbi:MAG: beta-N-acetylhexosaminidase, partial [Bdellovibrionales bacterium]|nr:beta-N-acetylhexosaminidase [Bdellovibrionales bacterium]
MTKELRHVIGQTFFVGISGKTLTPEESKFIAENNIGGVILFDRNLENPEQLYQLCQEIQKLRFKMVDQQPLFIGI